MGKMPWTWHVEKDPNQDLILYVQNEDGHIICETMCMEFAVLLAAAPDVYKALKAEREKEPCGPGCAGGGWRCCSGCDDRVKRALAKAEIVGKASRKTKEAGFEDIPTEKKCRDKKHDPPRVLSIPEGKQYRHLCPTCGYEIVLVSTKCYDCERSFNYNASRENPIRCPSCQAGAVD